MVDLRVLDQTNVFIIVCLYKYIHVHTLNIADTPDLDLSLPSLPLD